MSTPFSRKLIVPVALAAAALLTTPPGARAAEDVQAIGGGTGVARISTLEGTVTLQRGDSATATAAVVNAPVQASDYVTTAAGARGEIQFDGSAAVRLGGGVQLRFTRIDTGYRELEIAAGTIEMSELRGGGGASTQIDTPSISIRPRAAGGYRVTVDGAGVTYVTVRAGEAEIVTPDGMQVLAPGTTLRASGQAANPAIKSVTAVALDDFDRYNADRDQRESRALADTNAPPGVAGVDDLDRYGRWVDDGTYGTVWTPSSVAPDWAPYRDGGWTWGGPYGWTWIGSEPWGWAPYHYGRWYRSAAYGWCWFPSRAAVAWSPALVGFVTFGGSGFDSIAWVPLAPFEAFTPWWTAGRPNLVSVTNVYVTPPRGPVRHPLYRNWNGGATAVSRQRFLEGKFDRRVAVTPLRASTVRSVQGALPVHPSVANLRFSDAPVAPSVAASRPAAPQRVPSPVTVAVPVDSWSRFSASRGSGTKVMTIDGTTITSAKPVTAVRAAAPVLRAHDTPAWSRFDAATASRGTAPRDATVIREAGAARARTAPPSYARPVQRSAPPPPAPRTESRPARSNATTTRH